MEPLMLTEKIDNYLLGKMPDAERQAFEQEMEADAALKREVALQREIISALCEQASIEQQVRQDAEAVRQRVGQHEKHISKTHRLTISIISSIAVAACLTVAFIIPQLNRLQDIPTPDYSSIHDMYSQSTIRGGDNIFSTISEATALMDNSRYGEAYNILSAATEQMGNVTRDNKQQYEIKEDLLYLQAVCAIKRHQLFRSKRLLRQVADMKGNHQQEAEQLLRQITD